ncbi:hypothetical protein CLOM_g3396 [Closterium sp. NIES-68]|nr:hypothetical protein CLOM_g3396 [Closterium sp. NIES-68]GJP69934.1 hypothetical protein CLOP_g930 [Closterium sp. NIES-67]
MGTRIVFAALFGFNAAALILLASISLLYLPRSHATSLSPTECEALGFTGLALCSDCDQLATFVKDAKLEAECRSCCVTDEDKSTQQYASAVLEVCMRRVQWMPVVSEFIETKATDYPNLQVRYRINALPKLIMKDADGKSADVIRIENWKLEHIEQFLKEKLTAGTTTSAAA